MARFPNLKNKPARPAVSRRQLLIGGGAAVGLAVGWAVWPRSYSPNVNVAPDERLFNAWLKISTSGRVTVIVPQCEMGQGVTTLLPQVIADELGADWRSIAVEPAPVSPLYANIRDRRRTGCRDHTACPDTCRNQRGASLDPDRVGGARRRDVDDRVEFGARVRTIVPRCRRRRADGAVPGRRRSLGRRRRRLQDRCRFRRPRQATAPLRHACRRRGRPVAARRPDLSPARKRRALRTRRAAPRYPGQDRRISQFCRRHPPARHGLCRDSPRSARRHPPQIDHQGGCRADHRCHPDRRAPALGRGAGR